MGIEVFFSLLFVSVLVMAITIRATVALAGWAASESEDSEPLRPRGEDVTLLVPVEGGWSYEMTFPRVYLLEEEPPPVATIEWFDYFDGPSEFRLSGGQVYVAEDGEHLDVTDAFLEAYLEARAKELEKMEKRSAAKQVWAEDIDPGKVRPIVPATHVPELKPAPRKPKVSFGPKPPKNPRVGDEWVKGARRLVYDAEKAWVDDGMIEPNYDELPERDDERLRRFTVGNPDEVNPYRGQGTKPRWGIALLPEVVESERLPWAFYCTVNPSEPVAPTTEYPNSWIEFRAVVEDSLYITQGGNERTFDEVARWMEQARRILRDEREDARRRAEVAERIRKREEDKKRRIEAAWGQSTGGQSGTR